MYALVLEVAKCVDFVKAVADLTQLPYLSNTLLTHMRPGVFPNFNSRR